MNNPYCAPYEKVRDLYVNYMLRTSLEQWNEWSGAVGKEELKRQLDDKKGVFLDAIRAKIGEITKKSEFTEFLAALELSDFYFPNAEKEICFELRADVKPADIKTYEQLISAFEDNTHVDCLVRSAGEEKAIQVKRDGSDKTPKGFAIWIRDKILAKYGDMKGTSLVVFLGVPKDGTQVELDKYYKEFMKACPTTSFDSISIMYNSSAEHSVVLHEFLPNHKRFLIDNDLAMARLRGEA